MEPQRHQHNKKKKPELKYFRNNKKKWIQGYVPKEKCKKYWGPINSDSDIPIFRSSWEYKFINWLEKSESVRCWASEPFPIEYVMPGGDIHTYWPDFYVEMKSGEKYLIEIKPDIQTHRPSQIIEKKKYKQNPMQAQYAFMTWTKNIRKWVSAKKYCEEHGLVFKIITEDIINKI